MLHHRSLKLIALLSFTVLPLGTVACSNGSSPTEPAFDLDEPAVTSSTSSLTSVTGEARGRGRGGDDKGADDKGGNRGGGNRGDRGGRGGQDDKPRGQRGQEFEGTVVSAGPDSLTLAGGVQVVVNGQTQWIARGDLHSLSEVSRAVAAGRPTRAEGRGARQANGSFLAQTLKAEVDD